MESKIEEVFSPEELASTFLLPLPFIDIEHLSSVFSSVFFLSSCAIKCLFDMTFDHDYWALVSDYTRKKVDLNFTDC